MSLIKVRAKRMCYFNERRYREGDVFLIPENQLGNKGGMVRVPDDTPLSFTTAQQALDTFCADHNPVLGPAPVFSHREKSLPAVITDEDQLD
jgi:hypothetical protein